MKGPRKTLLASSILALPTLAHALGLGGIDVKSALNEPLIAEIQVIQAMPGEADGLLVALASAEDFARVGIDRGRIDTPLNFAVGKNARGETVIKVTTATPVREPFLNFLVEANWGKGRLLREYTVLLDPPVTAPARRPGATATAPVSQPTPVRPEPAPVPPTPKPAEPVAAAAPSKPTAPPPKPTPATQPEGSKPSTPAPVKPEPAPAPAPTPAPAPAPAPAAAAPAAPAQYGPVAQGETLWEIAQAAKPAGTVDMNRLMIALLRVNPQAFYDQNINALKRGAILRIPTQQEMAAISAVEAADAVKSQNDLWRSYQVNAAAKPTTLADAGASEALRPTAPATSTQGARLELVPPKAAESAAPGNAGAGRPTAASAASEADLKNARADLARAQEDLESSRQESTELRSRVSELEGIKADQERMLSLKSDELSTLQKRAAELEARIRELEKAAAEAAAKPPVTPPATTPTQPETSTAAATPDAGQAADESKPAVTAADIWGPSGTPPSGTPDEAPAEPAPDAQPATDVAAGEPDAGATTTEPDAGTTEPVADAGEEGAGPTTTPVPDAAVSEPEPVAQATEEPRPPRPPREEGLFSNPLVLGGLGAALLGLLGLFFMRRRKSAEEAAPAAVADSEEPVNFGIPSHQTGAAAGGLSAAELAEEEELVRRMAAEESSAAPALADRDPDFDNFRAEFEDDAQVAKPGDKVEWGLEQFEEPAAAAPAPAAPASTANEDFDFSFDEPTRQIEPVPAPAPAAAAKDDDFSFDFSFDEPASTTAPAPVAAAPEVDVEPSFDLPAAPSFDLPEPTPAPAPVAAAAPAEDFSLDLPELDFSNMEVQKPEVSKFEAPLPVEDFNEGVDDLAVFGDDAVATKLDLARAYIDMGDPDGARSMLEEVLAEGTAAQQGEAQRLMESLR